jgi:hypothetical protein
MSGEWWWTMKRQIRCLMWAVMLIAVTLAAGMLLVHLTELSTKKRVLLILVLVGQKLVSAPMDIGQMMGPATFD